MSEPLTLCQCSLALYVIEIDGEPVGYTCEHCDEPCEEKRCKLCAALSRSGAKTKD